MNLVVGSHLRGWAVSQRSFLPIQALSSGLLLLSAVVLARPAEISVADLVTVSSRLNQISLHAYLPDPIILGRTDTLVLELRNDSGKEAIANTFRPGGVGQRSCFSIELRDGSGNRVARSPEGMRRVGVSDPSHFLSGEPRQISALGKNPIIERFNLGELYELQPGETYFLLVRANVSNSERSGEDLPLQEVRFKVRAPP